MSVNDQDTVAQSPHTLTLTHTFKKKKIFNVFPVLMSQTQVA